MDELSKAASPAVWLIQVRNKPRNVAEIIVLRKFKLLPVSDRPLLRAKIKELMAPKLPQPLFPEVIHE